MFPARIFASATRAKVRANNLVKAKRAKLSHRHSLISRQKHTMSHTMEKYRAAGDGNVGALLDMNSIMIIDERRGTSQLEPLDFQPDFQTSWSSKLAKYELLEVLTEIDRDVDSLTWSDTDDESSEMHDVPMIPATSCSDGGDGQRRGVTFSSPLVTTVHTIPRLTPELIRVLYYSRAERFFFKKQYRLEKMMAQQDDPSVAYQTEMGIISNS